SYEKWIACSHVTLINAKCLRGTPEQLKWPRALWEALARMPRFLRSFVRTGAGTLVKKRIISWKLGEGTHVADHEVKLGEVHEDPFVCLGPIVLGGWDCFDGRK